MQVCAWPFCVEWFWCRTSLSSAAGRGVLWMKLSYLLAIPALSLHRSWRRMRQVYKPGLSRCALNPFLLFIYNSHIHKERVLLFLFCVCLAVWLWCFFIALCVCVCVFLNVLVVSFPVVDYFCVTPLMGGRCLFTLAAKGHVLSRLAGLPSKCCTIVRKVKLMRSPCTYGSSW